MAKKSHKFAWNGVDIDTALSASDLMSICTQVAAESNGSFFKTHRLEEAGRNDGAIAYVVKSALVRAFQLMTFMVEISADGERASLKSAIGTYSTTQYRVMYVIPLGGPEMVAHPTYMKFVRTVANTVTQADPTAKIRIREGKRGLEPLPPLNAHKSTQPASPIVAAPITSPNADVQIVTASASPFAQPEPISVLTPEPAATPSMAAPTAHDAITNQGEASVPTLTPTLVPPRGTSTKPESLAAAFQQGDIDDATTRMSRRAGTRREWAIELPDGRVIPVESPIIFGRDPIDEGYHNAQLVAVPDSSRFVSKTHAVIQPANGRITVTDLHSANGSVIVSVTGTETECEPAVPAVVREGASVEFGDYAITLRQTEG